MLELALYFCAGASGRKQGSFAWWQEARLPIVQLDPRLGLGSLLNSIQHNHSYIVDEPAFKSDIVTSAGDLRFSQASRSGSDSHDGKR